MGVDTTMTRNEGRGGATRASRRAGAKRKCWGWPTMRGVADPRPREIQSWGRTVWKQPQEPDPAEGG